MIGRRNTIAHVIKSKGKKTRQGNGKFSKYGNKGGGPEGSRPSKKYKKKYRGQGKKR
tara:strand:+ start:30 stop:200 length:171 start_codon:yes stop_codon:yes gene_type:complete